MQRHLRAVSQRVVWPRVVTGGGYGPASRPSDVCSDHSGTEHTALLTTGQSLGVTPDVSNLVGAARVGRRKAFIGLAIL